MEGSRQSSVVSRQQTARIEDRGSRIRRNAFLRLFFLCFFLSSVFCLLSSAFASALDRSVVEAKLARFVKQLYGENDDVRVRFNPVTISQNEKTKIKNISFVEMPDANGAGICSLELEQNGGRTRSVQVPFKVFTKRKIFMMRHPGKQGDIIRQGDISVKEIHLTGRNSEYPATAEDIIGRVLKRDIAANTVITRQILEDQIALQRGDLINIVLEGRGLLVRTKGKAIDKGRIGDTVRVKNVTSGREITGKIASGSNVVIQF